MKKKILYVMAFGAIALGGAFSFYQNRAQKTQVSELTLANVEALAGDEQVCEICYGFHLVTYSSTCKVCQSGGDVCNVHDQEPC